MPGSLCGFVVGVVLLCAGTVRAERSPSSLDWRWHEEAELVDCPAEEWVRDRLERRFEEMSEGAQVAAYDAKVIVELRKTEDGHAARLRVERGGEPPEVRELTTGADCADLEDAVVLALALLLARGEGAAAAASAGSGASSDSVGSRAEGARPGAESGMPMESVAPKEEGGSPKAGTGQEGLGVQQSPRASEASKAWLGMGAVVS